MEKDLETCKSGLVNKTFLCDTCSQMSKANYLAQVNYKFIFKYKDKEKNL